ncbi:putative membrane transport protein [Helianthus debilis subsp. tardiflorus]
MGFLDLFRAASMPVLQVLIVTALGSFLALESINILGESTRRQLNNLVFYVFNPALIGTKLADTITAESFLSLWFMPVNILLTFIIGSLLGWVLMLIAKPAQHLKGLVLGACSAGNLGNMLFIIVPAVCKEKGAPFGESDVCSEFGMAYASLSMAIGSIFLWTYVYNLVRVFSENSGNNQAETVQGDVTVPVISVTVPLPPPSEPESSGKMKVMLELMRQCWRSFSSHINLKAVFAPSTIGAIAGFIIGTIGPFRWLLIGNTAPLRVLHDSASLVGDASIPAVTLIVGANLLRGLKGSGMSIPLVLGIAAVRYIFLPGFGILIVKGALRFGLVRDDPLYLFVLLLQFALPPAMNIGTITQLFGAGESDCSVIMLWTYGLASIALTLWSTFFMWLVS